MKIAQVLQDYLARAGYRTQWLSGGEAATATALMGDVSLVILDVMLPGKDGLTVCEEIRAKSDVPILMLTARVDEIDRLRGLDLGADDYVCKPFSPREIVARVRNILKRSARPRAEPSGRYSYADIDWDEQAHECRVFGELVELTPIEFRMLGALLANPGRVCSRETLMHKAYNDGRIVSGRTIDSHIKNLRAKLGAESAERIQSMYGVGYKIE